MGVYYFSSLVSDEVYRGDKDIFNVNIKIHH